MEDTLRGGYPLDLKKAIIGLNPCFNGRYSQSSGRRSKNLIRLVLILVLMEDTLRAAIKSQVVRCVTSLNPCFNGRYSQSVIFSLLFSN